MLREDRFDVGELEALCHVGDDVDTGQGLDIDIGPAFEASPAAADVEALGVSRGRVLEAEGGAHGSVTRGARVYHAGRRQLPAAGLVNYCREVRCLDLRAGQ